MSTSVQKDYRERLEKRRREANEKTREAQDIGAIPKVIDPDRKAVTSQDLKAFLFTYFPDVFTVPWAAYHDNACRMIQDSCVGGGLFSYAFPRETGKTVMSIGAVLWATLTGKVSYAALIGATEKDAVNRLRGIKTSLETNQLLLEDFPEAVYPIRCLERSTRRAAGQKHHGEPTAIVWDADRIVLPRIKDAICSEAVIHVAGLTGAIRGWNYQRRDGSVVRPQLAICDDPQTRESARSRTQTDDRERIIKGDVAYMSGSDRAIAVFVPCTVVHRNDLADRLLDRNRNPEFRGYRAKMLESFPTNRKKWDHYADLRADGLRSGEGSDLADSFYREHQEEMDKGAVVSWPERFPKNCISAIQHAMNLYLRDPVSFAAEGQNDPEDELQLAIELKTADEIAEKTIPGAQRYKVPLNASHLISFCDLHKRLLYYVTIAFDDVFNGTIVDYGTIPSQGRRDFTLANASSELTGETSSERCWSALAAFEAGFLDRDFEREDGARLRIKAALVDANWGEVTEIVYQFCRESAHKALWLPCHGTDNPWRRLPSEVAETKKKKERKGIQWRLGFQRGCRYLVYNASHWKVFTHARWATNFGGNGCLSLYGKTEDGEAVRPYHHVNFAGHQVAEEPYQSERSGEKVIKWQMKLGETENHWGDGVVGCHVGASTVGVEMAGAKQAHQEQWSPGPPITREYLQSRGII